MNRHCPERSGRASSDVSGQSCGAHGNERITLKRTDSNLSLRVTQSYSQVAYAIANRSAVPALYRLELKVSDSSEQATTGRCRRWNPLSRSARMQLSQSATRRQRSSRLMFHPRLSSLPKINYRNIPAPPVSSMRPSVVVDTPKASRF